MCHDDQRSAILIFFVILLFYFLSRTHKEPPTVWLIKLCHCHYMLSLYIIWLQVNSSHGELVTKVKSSQWSRHRVKSSHGEVVTKVKKRDSELVSRHLWRVHRVTSSLAPSNSMIFKNSLSASWPVRELSSTRLDSPRVGLLANCPASTDTTDAVIREKEYEK